MPLPIPTPIPALRVVQRPGRAVLVLPAIVHPPHVLAPRHLAGIEVQILA